MKKISATIIMVFLFTINLFSQTNLSFERVSPHATISQDIGFATIKVDYSRPGAKHREIWGELVPYGLAPNPFGNGKPMPWRVGANENTVVEISHNTLVNGNKLPAGKYSLHAIVEKDIWTIIFNKDIHAWGSFFYNKENDALRIKVKPIKNSFKEWLTFDFDDLSLGSATLNLMWGELRIPIKFEFNRYNITLEKFRNELSNLAGFNNAAWANAARYCLDNKINYNEAMLWIDKALNMNGGNNFTNKSIKAGLLTVTGNKMAGDKLMSEALKTATEVELNAYGYQLLGQGRLDDAIEIFKINIQRHPDSWNVYDSLAEALNNKGDKEEAELYYKKALEKAPKNQIDRIKSIIKGL